MKTVAIVLGALSFAATAHASTTSMNERPELVSVNPGAVETIEVPAGTVLSSKERQRASLKASDLVSVTLVGDGRLAGHADRSSRGDY